MSKKEGSRQAATPISKEKFATIVKVVAEETERGCVLLASAVIEDALEILLRAKFAAGSGLEIDSPGKGGKLIKGLFFDGALPPLGSFSMKIKLCWALGLITQDVAKAIDKFRKMRNSAAHPDKPFGINQQVSAQLTSVVAEGRRKRIAEVVANQEQVSTSKAELAATAVFLAMDLEDRANVAYDPSLESSNQ